MNTKEFIPFTEAFAKECLPNKDDKASKITYGKTLVIAGSKDIYGACFFALKGALTSGAGMVKCITHKNNRYTLQKEIPEAMYTFYQKFLIKDYKKSIDWADTIIVGPGLSQDYTSKKLLKKLPTYLHKGQILIVDADAINVFSKNRPLFDKLIKEISNKQIECVFTPHDGEAKRLIKGLNLCEDIDEALFTLFKDYGISSVRKGNQSKIFSDTLYINTSGNEAMATAGSGDVLSGILGGFLFRRKDLPFSKRIAASVYVHGLLGDICVEQKDSLCVTASDLLNSISLAFSRL